MSKKTVSMTATTLVALGVVITLLNWQRIYRAVMPPNPQIASYGADDSSSMLFDYSMRVWAEIRNDGGDGEVVFEVTVHQDGHGWTKSTTLQLDSKETERVELLFDEIGIFQNTPRYTVDTYPLGMPGH